MPLAEFALGIDACGIEISQANTFEPVCRGIIAEQLLHQLLAAPIRVDGGLGMILVDGGIIGISKNRRGGRKHEHPDPVPHHGVQHNQHVAEIIAKITGGVLHRGAHFDEGREVHHRIDRVLEEHLAQ